MLAKQSHSLVWRYITGFVQQLLLVAFNRGSENQCEIEIKQISVNTKNIIGRYSNESVLSPSFFYFNQALENPQMHKIHF